MQILGSLIFISMMLNAKDLTIKGDYESSISILSKIKVTKEIENDYNYLQAVNSFGIGDKNNANKFAILILDNFNSKAERRQEILAEIILIDIKEWEDGDLNDIGRLMKRSNEKLNNGRPKQAELPQKEALDKLNRLIKEIEDAEKNKSDLDNSNGPNSKRPSNSSSKPAEDSEIFESLGKGKIDEKTLRKIQENWGTLPEKTREMVRQQISREIPDKYKSMVESYHKSLNSVNK